MIVFNFDLTDKSCNDGIDVFNLSGWCYCDENYMHFSCHDSEDPDKQYQVNVSTFRRSDVNEIINVSPEQELGVALQITIPAEANGILVVANGADKTAVPLGELHPQYGNLSTSALWKELRKQAVLSARQKALTDLSRHVVFNFEQIDKESCNDGIDVYNLSGWCYCDENYMHFSCHDSEDPDKQYQVNVSTFRRSDVNEIINVSPEQELGVALQITIPAEANGILVVANGADKTAVPLKNLQPQHNNIAVSELWNNLREKAVFEAEQKRLANPARHVIYNFDIVEKSNPDGNTDLYSLAGWFYYNENRAHFSCHDSTDLQKTYPVFVIRNFRNDLNRVLGIRPENEPGFSLAISLPSGTRADLVIHSGNLEIKIPLNELHSQCSNIAISDLWRELRKAALLEEELEISEGRKNSGISAEKICRHSSWGTHLLLVVHFADRTGAPLLALNIAEQLFKMGYNLHVIVLRNGELVQDLSRWANVYVAELENEETFQNILDELKQYNIKTAYLNTTVSGYYARVLKKNNYTVVTLVHEMARTLQRMSLQTAAENTINFSDKIVIPSLLIKESWLKFNQLYMPNKITTVMPQPDYHFDLQRVPDEERLACRREICRDLNLPEDAILVLGCGTLEERKKPDVFFQTAALTAEKYSNVCFIWIGDYGESLYKLKIAAIAGALPDNARLLPYQNLNRYFHAADIFFLPSSEDPFPTVALLAAKNSMPIVYHRKSTGISDLFNDVEGCAAFEHSADAFSQLIENFASSKSLRTKAGKECAAAYKNRMYSFKDYVIMLLAAGSVPMPRISCIIPNYNYAKYLPERLQNIVEQTYPIDEVIILDDCSSDESDSVIQDLIKEYQSCFPGGIRYIKNDKNAGVFRQWMRGAAMARNNLIWIAEADDNCSVLLMSKLVHAFTFNPEVKLAYSQSAMLSEDGSVTEAANLGHTADISLVKWEHDYISSAINEIENNLSIRNTIPNASAALINREALLQIPKELFQFKVAGDWFAYLHILSGGNVAFCAEALNYYRRHAGSAVAKNPGILISEISGIYRFILENYDLSAQTALHMKNEYLRSCTYFKTAPGSVEHFDNYIKLRQKEQAFIFIFDSVSAEIKNLLEIAGKLIKENKNSSPERVFFLCAGHFSLPPEFASYFPEPVHVLYSEDLCLYGFEKAFCRRNKFRAAAVFMRTTNIEKEHRLLAQLPQKTVIETDSAESMENAPDKLKEFLSNTLASAEFKQQLKS